MARCFCPANFRSGSYNKGNSRLGVTLWRVDVLVAEQGVILVIVTNLITEVMVAMSNE